MFFNENELVNLYVLLENLIPNFSTSSSELTDWIIACAFAVKVCGIFKSF